MSLHFAVCATVGMDVLFDNNTLEKVSKRTVPIDT